MRVHFDVFGAEDRVSLDVSPERTASELCAAALLTAGLPEKQGTESELIWDGRRLAQDEQIAKAQPPVTEDAVLRVFRKRTERLDEVSDADLSRLSSILESCLSMLPGNGELVGAHLQSSDTRLKASRTLAQHPSQLRSLNWLLDMHTLVGALPPPPAEGQHAPPSGTVTDKMRALFAGGKKAECDWLSQELGELLSKWTGGGGAGAGGGAGNLHHFVPRMIQQQQQQQQGGGAPQQQGGISINQLQAALRQAMQPLQQQQQQQQQQAPPPPPQQNQPLITPQHLQQALAAALGQAPPALQRPPPQAPQPPRFREEVSQLVEFGFTDRAQNEQVLETVDGDLNAALELLIAMRESTQQDEPMQE